MNTPPRQSSPDPDPTDGRVGPEPIFDTHQLPHEPNTHAAGRPPLTWSFDLFPGDGPFGGPSPVPGFDLIAEVGRGGMGVVYRAVQKSLNRTVALKLSLWSASASEAARFLVEAEAVAAIGHPNVVRVFEAGQCAGRPFLVMEFLPGGTLSRRVKRDGRLAPREAAGVVAKLARGVQAAHDAGVVHRDLKPSNVLLDDAGEPKVSDFGLAKRGDGGGLTLTNVVMGTPAYMAPEQAAGGTKRAGPAADVYGLGVILYEVLTGGVPFQAAESWDILRQVLNDPPRPPRERVPAVPRDLDLICLKCLEKDPRERYPTAAALADDLDRFLRGEAVSVRPPGAAERLGKWASRHPTAVRLIGLGVAALMVILALTFKFNADLREAGLRAEVAEAERVAAERAAGEREFFRLLTDARNRRLAARPGWTWAARADLTRAAALPHDPADDLALRDELAAALTAPDAREIGRWPAVIDTDDGHHLLAHPTRPLLAATQFGFTETDDPPHLTVCLYDTATGRRTHTLTAPIDLNNQRPGGFLESPDGLAFSPDGRWLVMAARSGRLHRWDLTALGNGTPTTWAGRGLGFGLAFSPDGRRLYARGGTWLQAWDTTTWTEVTARDLGESAYTITPVPDAERLVVATNKGVRFLDPFDLTDLNPPLPAASHSHLAVAPDGRTGLASDGASVRVLDLFGRRAVGELDYRGPSHNPQPFVSPDGRFAAVTRVGLRKVTLFDLTTGRKVCDLPTPERPERPPVAFDPDGRRLYVGGRNETVVYELNGPRLAALHPWPIRGLCGSPDGRTLYAHTPMVLLGWGNPAELSAWAVPGRVGPPRAIRPLTRGGGSGGVGEVSLVRQAGGPWLTYRAGVACGGWNTETDAPITEHQRPTSSAPGQKVGFGPGDRLWLACGNTAEAFTLPLLAPAKMSYSDPVLLKDRGQGAADCLIGGRTGVLVADGEGGVAWLGGDGTPAAKWQAGLARATALALTADESVAVVGLASGKAGLFRLPAGKRLAAWDAHVEQVTAACWLSDDTFATAGEDRTLSFWRVTGGAVARLFTLPTAGVVRTLVPVTDGGLAVLEHDARGVKVLDLPALEREFVGVNLGVGLKPAELPPDPVVPCWEKPPPPRTRGMRVDYFSHPPGRLDDQVYLAAVFRDEPRGLWPEHDQCPCSGVWGGHYRALYRGWLTAPKPGKYTLHVKADDFAQVYLDGRMVGETAGVGKEVDVELVLTDRPHRLLIDHSQLLGAACLLTTWTGPDGKPWVPGDALTPTRPAEKR